MKGGRYLAIKTAISLLLAYCLVSLFLYASLRVFNSLSGQSALTGQEPAVDGMLDVSNPMTYVMTAVVFCAFLLIRGKTKGLGPSGHFLKPTVLKVAIFLIVFSVAFVCFISGAKVLFIREFLVFPSISLFMVLFFAGVRIIGALNLGLSGLVLVVPWIILSFLLIIPLSVFYFYLLACLIYPAVYAIFGSEPKLENPFIRRGKK